MKKENVIPVVKLQNYKDFELENLKNSIKKPK